MSRDKDSSMFIYQLSLEHYEGKYMYELFICWLMAFDFKPTLIWNNRNSKQVLFVYRYMWFIFSNCGIKQYNVTFSLYQNYMTVLIIVFENSLIQNEAANTLQYMYIFFFWNFFPQQFCFQKIHVVVQFLKHKEWFIYYGAIIFWWI